MGRGRGRGVNNLRQGQSELAGAEAGESLQTQVGVLD